MIILTLYFNANNKAKIKAKKNKKINKKFKRKKGFKLKT